MSSHIDNKKLPQHLNKRIKLTPARKAMIKAEYEQGNISQRELARKYDVSRRSIVFAIYPERYTHALSLRRQRWEEGKYREHYNREQHTNAMRDIRDRKKKHYKTN